MKIKIIAAFVFSVIVPFGIYFIPVFWTNFTEPINTITFFATFASLSLSVLYLYLDVHFVGVCERQEKILERQLETLDILKAVAENRCATPVTKVQVYQKMEHFVSCSQQRAMLMYMNEKPPETYHPSVDKKNYYGALEREISKGRISITRLVYLSTQNKEWIRKYVDSNKDNNQFSLYVILKNHLNDGVSVQLFDDSIVVLMNINDSTISLNKIAVVIESKEINSLFESYYERIRSKSIPIIENGTINQKNYNTHLGVQKRRQVQATT